MTSPPPGREPLPTRVDGLPTLPPEYRATLAAGLAVLDAELAPDAIAAIGDHVRLLMAWNAAINLTAIREPAAIAREHVLDSLAALPVLRRAGVHELLDLGSGGGFPGLPLALALPAERALLVESIGKKAGFLSVVAEALGLADRVRVAAVRSEALAADRRHRERWQAVVARAVASLPELAELSLPLVRPGGLLVAWKRTDAAEDAPDEAALAEPALAELGGRLAAVEPVAIPGLEDHVLVVVEKAGPTPARFPRDPAARRRKPLGGGPRHDHGPLGGGAAPSSRDS